MQNVLKSNKWQRIWVAISFKIEIQKRGPNNSDVLHNWSPPPEIRSPLFNLQKFQKSYKINPESCRMHWNLMNDEEFRSLNLLKLKYRRRDQIIQSFCRPGSPQKLVPPSLICGNLKSLGKALVNHAECFKI